LGRLTWIAIPPSPGANAEETQFFPALAMPVQRQKKRVAERPLLQTSVISSGKAPIFIKPQMSGGTVCKPLIFPMFPAIPA
jgi:hypothetical protein